MTLSLGDGRACRCLLAGLPSRYCHLQGSVGGENGGLEGQVGHGAASVLPPEPALHGASLIGIPICGADAS